MGLSMTQGAIYQRKLRVRMAKEGRCGCGATLKPGERVSCAKCKKSNKENSKKRRSKLRILCRKLGICDRCFRREAMETRNQCGVCAEYLDDWKLRQKKRKRKERREAREKMQNVHVPGTESERKKGIRPVPSKS